MNATARAARTLDPIHYPTRISSFIAQMVARKWTSVLLVHPPNIRYLTGFSGSAGLLLVSSTGLKLLTDGRYAEQAAQDVRQANLSDVQITTAFHREHPRIILGWLRGMGDVIVEADFMPARLYLHLTTRAERFTLTASGSILNELRSIKSIPELQRMQLACSIADDALAQCLPQLETAPTEASLAGLIELAMRNLGADDRSFATIVASGVNSSRPHATPSHRRIQPGDLVIVDMGAAFDGYHSDMTRTVWYGDLPSSSEELYEAVRATYMQAKSLVREGVTHEQIDNECHRVLRYHGFEHLMRHPSGHNIGLEVHERPFLDAGETDVLSAGQAIALEPGAYLPGAVGVRIEDTLVVGKESSSAMSHSPIANLDKHHSGEGSRSSMSTEDSINDDDDDTAAAGDSTVANDAGESPAQQPSHSPFVDASRLDAHARFLLGDN